MTVEPGVSNKSETTQRDGFYRNVIAAVDGSEFSVHVLRAAATIADAIDAEVTLLTAGSAGVDLPHVAAAVETANLAEPLDIEFVGIDEAHRSTADAILGYTANADNAIIFMGSHGRSGLLTVLLGSVSGEIIEKSRAPVMLFGPKSRSSDRYTRIVACVDGSEFALAIIDEAEAWAKALGVPLWLVEVVEPEPNLGGIETNYVHNVAQKMRNDGVELEWDVLHSKHPAKAILEWVGDDAGTILALATHGRTGLRRVLLGSVVADVIHGARGPVLTCMPAK